MEPHGAPGNTSQVELAQVVIVLGHRALALVHLDRHSGLVVAVGGERLGEKILIDLITTSVCHTWVCLVGMVVFLLIREVMTPPAVSIPRERGATSNSKRSETASLVSPVRIAACKVQRISSEAIYGFL